MMKPFNRDEFVDYIKEEAIKQGMIEEALLELNAFEREGKLEYLYVVSDFMKTLENVNVPAVMLTHDGGASFLAYLLHINKVNPKTCGLTNHYFLSNPDIYFEICVAREDYECASRIFSHCVDIKKKDEDYIYFGENNDRIGIYSSFSLDQLYRLEKESGLKYDSIPFDDDDVWNYLFTPYDFGYYMPNLYECNMNRFEFAQEILKIARPKGISGLAKIHALSKSSYRNKKVLQKTIEERGLDDVISSKEQVFKLLKDRYHFADSKASEITSNIANGKLKEENRLFLLSEGVSEYLIDQFKNIKSLSNEAFAYQSAYMTYLLGYYKYHYLEAFKKSLIMPPFLSYVGPYFYIGGKFFCHKEKAESFDWTRRFFDSEVSHFNFFQTLGIDADYGNFPRGRVLFDNYKRKYIVYLDSSLNHEQYKEELVRIYELDLDMSDVVFKKDSHYTHDGL